MATNRNYEQIISIHLKKCNILKRLEYFGYMEIFKENLQIQYNIATSIISFWVICNSKFMVNINVSALCPLFHFHLSWGLLLHLMFYVV